jgi:putative heme-binding domain-containing protein
MRKALSVGLTLSVGFVFAVSAIAQDKQPPTAQIQRGHDLFVKSSKGTPCVTCHRLAGEGTAVGPDLTTMASMGTVHSIVMTMHMTMTNYVQAFKTANGVFPGMLKEKQGDESQIWDLSATPPVLRTLASKQILSAERDDKWKHPPASVDYTSQELADLVGFLRWAATGSVKEIKASEVE